MPVFDPFSAASKPMPDWDSIPSKPLPFAATLHALDINAMPSPGHTVRLPRPLKENEFPKTLPTPVYSHARHGSISATPSSPSLHVATVGSDQWWKQKVAQCVDFAKGDLVVSDCDLEELSPRILDLRDLVTLSHVQSPSASPSNLGPNTTLSPRSPLANSVASPSNNAAAFGERSFSRTHSAPASAAFFSKLQRAEPTEANGRGALLPPPELSSTPKGARPVNGRQERSFMRSKTGVSTRFTRTAPNIGVYAQQNRLRSLPTALFQIRNLTVLSLRRNNLTTLPAAIGQLVNLKELNISSNQITHLPSTILDLTSLEQFMAHPNPWRLPPANDDAHAAGFQPDDRPRLLSPLQSKVPGNVPSLRSTCLAVLLSPRLPTYQAPLTRYDWNDCIVGGRHPLLDPEVLHGLMPPSFSREDLVRIQQAVRSAAAEAPKSRSNASVDGIPFMNDIPKPDDAATNPYFYECPSHRHSEWNVKADHHRATRRIFLDPAEERFEWVDIAKAKNIPILWLGCSPGCLAFLDEDQQEEDDWPFGDSDDDTFEWTAAAV